MTNCRLGQIQLMARSRDVTFPLNGLEHYEQVEIGLTEMHAAHITGFVRFIWRIRSKSLGWKSAGVGDANGLFSVTKSAGLQRTSLGFHAGPRSARGA